MKKIGFMPNTSRDSGLSATSDLMGFVANLGYEVASLSEYSGQLPSYCELVDSPDALCQISDFIVTLGGDGTVLKAAEYAALTATPLLGINLGNVGYLTDCERANAKEAITKVVKGNYKIQERMMLQVSHDGGAPRLALNDVTINRGLSSRLIQCVVHINGEYMDTFRADGIIISTPTGSTAYNLAAGGPIVRPEAKMVVITPISPHSLSTRPAVISHEDIVSIRFVNNHDIVVSADGEAISLPSGPDYHDGETEILISQAKYNTRTIKTNSFGFYEILRMKFSKSL